MVPRNVHQEFFEVGVVGASLIVMFYLSKAVYELVRKKAGLDGGSHGLVTSSEWAIALDRHTKAMKSNVHEMEKVLRNDREERAKQQDKHVRALLDINHKQELAFAKLDAMIDSGILGFGMRGGNSR